jgi:putative RNA 2'-phosphotransferase
MSKEKELSKFLSLLLRHQPDVIGIELDANGWVSVEELLRKLALKGWIVSQGMLEKVVQDNDKQRFTFDEAKERIRANQGHSVAVDLEFEAVRPPAVLFHGTAVSSVLRIREEGLKSQSRQYVHLSRDERTAMKVGRRHGVPTVLRIRAEAMYEEGFEFYVSKNQVWLTKAVPVVFIDFEERGV